SDHRFSSNFGVFVTISQGSHHSEERLKAFVLRAFELKLLEVREAADGRLNTDASPSESVLHRSGESSQHLIPVADFGGQRTRVVLTRTPNIGRLMALLTSLTPVVRAS